MCLNVLFQTIVRPSLIHAGFWIHQISGLITPGPDACHKHLPTLPFNTYWATKKPRTRNVLIRHEGCACWQVCMCVWDKETETQIDGSRKRERQIERDGGGEKEVGKWERKAQQSNGVEKGKHVKPVRQVLITVEMHYRKMTGVRF